MIRPLVGVKLSLLGVSVIGVCVVSFGELLRRHHHLVLSTGKCTRAEDIEYLKLVDC
jgi:hypothetical protein